MPKATPTIAAPNATAHQSAIDRLAAAVDRLEAEVRRRDQAEGEWQAERLLLRSSFAQAPDFQYVKDTAGRFVAVNQRVARFHGFEEPAEMIGLTDFDIDSSAHARVLFEAEQQLMRDGTLITDLEEHYVGPTGRTGWYLTSKVPLRDEHGIIVGLAGVTRDITARKHAELLREEQAQLLEMIATDMPLPEILARVANALEGQIDGGRVQVLVLDESGSPRLGIAPALPASFGAALQFPRPARRPAPGGRRARAAAPTMTIDTVWPEHGRFAEEHGLRLLWSRPILARDRTMLGLIAVYGPAAREPPALDETLVRMLTQTAAIAIERKRAEERIGFLARHDALTGLPTRAALEERLIEGIQRTARHQGWGCVVFLDLDQFKTVNDSLGHAAGDDLLRTMARRMTAAVRPGDSVLRMGGDEFILLLTDLPPSRAAITTVLERIKARIARPVRLCRHTLGITCSMGVAVYPADGSDVETLLVKADAAMYRAKQAGRDNFQFHANVGRALTAPR
ncbi:MAG: diguanylate cyclase [Devosia sp.]|nr:diguanylate cyclase [Devosia sp.]